MELHPAAIPERSVPGAMHPRYAIYYTPPPFLRLAAFASGVLGDDASRRLPCFRQACGHRPARPEADHADPRRYGFHATIVAPFDLRGHSEDELLAAANHFAGKAPPVRMQPGGRGARYFIALVPVRSKAEISRLAATSLEAFDAYRAPLSAADRERRSRIHLTLRQIELMDRWEYPFVLDEYRFHMTLTGALPEQSATISATRWRRSSPSGRATPSTSTPSRRCAWTMPAPASGRRRAAGCAAT